MYGFVVYVLLLSKLIFINFRFSDAPSQQAIIMSKFSDFNILKPFQNIVLIQFFSFGVFGQKKAHGYENLKKRLLKKNCKIYSKICRYVLLSDF